MTRALPTAGLCNSLPLLNDDDQAASIQFHPSGDYDESEMMREFQFKMKEDEQKKLEKQLKKMDPNATFIKLGGETWHFTQIDSLTEGVGKLLQDNPEALSCSKDWIAYVKSTRYANMAKVFTIGAGAGCIIGGIASGAAAYITASKLLGVVAALKLGVIGGVVGGVVGCVLVLAGYGIYWLYRRHQSKKALENPKREDLIKRLAKCFVIEAHARKAAREMEEIDKKAELQKKCS